mgnify:CR=1 FL=1
MLKNKDLNLYITWINTAKTIEVNRILVKCSKIQSQEILLGWYSTHLGVIIMVHTENGFVIVTKRVLCL